MPAPQKNNRRDRNNNKPQHRINEQIRCREVRIVGDDVESEVMPTRQAIQLAQQKGVDLVEISPNAVPPVCRLINYSKFLYQQKKRQKELKAKQVKIEVKEIRFGPQTDEHDYNFKLKHAKEFLSEGDKVKAYVFSVVALSSLKNKAKYFCFVLPTTLKNMAKWNKCLC